MKKKGDLIFVTKDTHKEMAIYEWKSSDYGLMCHELHHFIHCSLPNNDIKYCEDTEEVYAHLQGWFMDLIVRAFIKLKKIKKV